jgi:hypothetical protein
MGRGIIMIKDIATFKRELFESKRYKLGEYTTACLLSSKSTPLINNEEFNKVPEQI